MSRVLLPNKYAGELTKYVFDFTSRFDPGEEILTSAVTCALYSGVDANPAGMISGITANVGSQVQQNITGGVAGCIYTLTCTVQTSYTETLKLQGFIAVLPSQP